jgi:Mitochondrial carrier protein
MVRSVVNITPIFLLGILSSVGFAFSPVVPKQQRFPFSFADSPPINKNALLHLHIRGGSVSTTKQYLVNPALATVMAGSLAGAIGVGVAFPLDTLKTKSQLLGQQKRPREAHPDNQLVANEDGSVTLEYQPKQGLIPLVKLILQTEGVAGFFGGVRAMMIGQALIKAVAFSANTAALQALQPYALASVVSLILAACFAGFVTSFLVAPVERVKVMMQASSQYGHELDCLKAVLNTEGWEGLLGRGLGPTLAREVPSYGIYFVVYGLLMQTAVATWLGGAAPLLFGALAGCASWIPVYPVDVVKVSVPTTCWLVLFDVP